LNIHDRLTYLLRQVAGDSATDAELEELAALLKADESGRLAREMEAQLKAALPPDDAPYDPAYWDGIADKILAADRTGFRPAIVTPMRRPRIWARAVAAAVALLLVSGAAYWLQRRPATTPAPVTVQTPGNDIAPGGNKAVLTLADGTQVPLDSAANGRLAMQGQTTVLKLDSGQLAYRPPAGPSSNTPGYNTITTPRGGQFRIALPDGSQVWLNASSSLRYPIAFTGRERRVELTGEAYFEVAKRSDMPFRVGTGGMLVEVLGTHFNIMAYADEEAVKTTLLEGAVKVTKGPGSKRLLPGQQASLYRANDRMEVDQHANTEEVVAWKNGLIQFEGQDLKTAMRLIARWYNVEVEYRAAPGVHFRGVIPRNVPVSEVLKMMEMTGEVRFSISGNKIIVLPAA
jgi:transmembrane sensor